MQLHNMHKGIAKLLLFHLRNSQSYTLDTHSSKKNIIEICAATGNSVALAIEKFSSYRLCSIQDDDIFEILLTVNTRQLCFGNWELYTLYTLNTLSHIQEILQTETALPRHLRNSYLTGWSRMQILFFSCHRQEAKIRFIFCNEPLFSFVKMVVDE